MTKNQLRAKYTQLRKALSETDKSEMSFQIADRALQLPIWDRQLYHIYLPITEKSEVDTEYLLNIIWGKDKTVVVSKSNFAKGTMSNVILTENMPIRKNPYGIPEPEDGVEVTAKAIDIIFVPLLAFDLTGHRIGYGKGFYDRFLETCRKDAVKIGLSFFDAEPAFEEVFESDVRLDHCITPNLTYRF